MCDLREMPAFAFQATARSLRQAMGRMKFCWGSITDSWPASRSPTGEGWWEMADSNCRLLACEASALTN